MLGDMLCKFFKFGHCKFGLTCSKQHVKECCENSTCDILVCSLRHPRKCKYYTEYQRCKFGDFCSYIHENVIESVSKVEFKSLEKETSNLKIKIEHLEDLLKEKDSGIRNLEKAVAYLSDSLEKKCDKFDHDQLKVPCHNTKVTEEDVEIVYEGNNSLDEIINIPQLDGSMVMDVSTKPELREFLDSQGKPMVWFQCVECKFNSTCEAQLKKHVNKRHKLKKLKK